MSVCPQICKHYIQREEYQTAKEQTYFHSFIHTIHTMLIFSQSVHTRGILQVYDNSSVWGPLSVPLPLVSPVVAATPTPVVTPPTTRKIPLPVQVPVPVPVPRQIPKKPPTSSRMISPHDINYLLQNTEVEEQKHVAPPSTARTLFSSFGMMTRAAPNASGSCGCGMRG